MPISDLQQSDPDLLRDRCAHEQDHQLHYALARGYSVLPITAPFEGYIVTYGKRVLARCSLLMEAAQIAAALAHYQECRRAGAA